MAFNNIKNNVPMYLQKIVFLFSVANRQKCEGIFLAFAESLPTFATLTQSLIGFYLLHNILRQLVFQVANFEDEVKVLRKSCVLPVLKQHVR